MADTTTTAQPATPLWADQTAQQFGNAMSGALTNVANLGNNWYSGPLTAGLTTQQQNLIGQAPGTAGQWQAPFQAGMNQVQQSSQWDPNQMQQHLNPYLTGVLDEIARRGNQNLTEKIMPNVNRTFTGSGLFGSSGNAEFLNRGIRDTQDAILGQQATAGLQAYNQAAQDYLNWGQLGTQGGQAQTTGALAGQGQAWTDLAKQYELEEQQRLNTQAGMDASYKDWQAQLTTPINMMGALSKMMPDITGMYKGANTVVNTSNPAASSALTDLLALINLVGAGASGGGA